MNQKNVLMTLLFVLAMGGSIGLMRSSFLKMDEVNISQPTTPDAYMTQAVYTRFDEAGDLNSRIYAHQVKHYPDQDTSLFESPSMIAHSDKETTWQIASDTGLARHGMQVLYLTGHVQIDRRQGKDTKILTLKTTALTAYPQQKFAQTDQPVTIIQPTNVIQAVGLTADLNTGDIHLLSQVKGIYHTSSHSRFNQ